MIDESKINPNLDKLHQHFDSVLGKYFEGTEPIPEYFENVNCYNCGSTEIITSFVDGINAYIDMTRRNPDLLPMEFRFLGLKPGQWTPEVVVSRHNGLFRNISSEISLARRVEVMGSDEVVRLSNYQPGTPDLEVAEGLDLSLISNRITRLYSSGRASIRFRPEDILPEYRALPSESGKYQSGRSGIEILLAVRSSPLRCIYYCA